MLCLYSNWQPRYDVSSAYITVARNNSLHGSIVDLTLMVMCGDVGVGEEFTPWESCDGGRWCVCNNIESNRRQLTPVLEKYTET